MKRSFRTTAIGACGAAVLVASAVAVTPAYAAPWDGNDIVFGPGDWDVENYDFAMDDVYLVFPDTSTEYTDIWDGAGQTTIFAPSLGINDETVFCENDFDVDVEVEAGTGDLVFTCIAANAAFAVADVSVVSEIRVLAGGEVVRFLTTITNNSDADIEIDSVQVETDFGSSGDLWNYGNQSDAILPVPAEEDGTDYSTQLNEAEAKWIVHREEDDAPGGIIIGTSDSTATAQWLQTDGDTYSFEVPAFSIPAGESRAVVSFVNWDPQSLIDGDYNNDGDDQELLDLSADAVVSSMSTFDSLDGLLASGIDAPVVNWVIVPVEEEEEEEAEEPELADTGVAEVTGLVFGAMVLLVGGAVLTARRRVRA